MKKNEFNELIKECSKEKLDEIDFKKLQQKLGKGIRKTGEFFGNEKLSGFGKDVAKGKGGYGAKLDKTFNTQGYQDRENSLHKRNNSKKVVKNLKDLIEIWNFAMDSRYKELNPNIINEFNGDLEKLIAKYRNILKQ